MLNSKQYEKIGRDYLIWTFTVLVVIAFTVFLVVTPKVYQEKVLRIEVPGDFEISAKEATLIDFHGMSTEYFQLRKGNTIIQSSLIIDPPLGWPKNSFETTSQLTPGKWEQYGEGATILIDFKSDNEFKITVFPNNLSDKFISIGIIAAIILFLIFISFYNKKNKYKKNSVQNS